MKHNTLLMHHAITYTYVCLYEYMYEYLCIFTYILIFVISIPSGERMLQYYWQVQVSPNE